MKFAGLTTSEISLRRLKFGPNTLPEEKSFGALGILLTQFKSPLIYIMFGVLAVSFYFHEYLDIALISLMVLLNIAMGFFQEYGAQKTLSALKQIIKPTAEVIRNGVRVVINASDLVPGDLVLLGSGNSVPADGRLIDAVDILVTEAILTGEEEPITKSLKDGHNLLFMGTTILSGRGTMEVETIGQKTEIGKIGKSLKTIVDKPTPLQSKLEVFSRSLVLLIIGISVLIFFIGLQYQQNVWNMLRFSIILSVAAIPEGLPIAVTVILSIGVRRILKKNGLVKKLLSIETLGATSVICTDKTGTLTEGVMQVVRTDLKNHQQAIKGLAMLNTQRTSLEIALWKFLKKELGYDPQIFVDKAKLIHEEAFESDKKYAKTIAQIGGKTFAYVIGAPEVILNFCTLNKKTKARIISEFENWARSGLRVVGLCEKLNSSGISNTGYAWTGLIGVKDPVRKSVSESIHKAQAAGIDIKIVTGDYLHTALRVAKEVGLEVLPKGTMEGDYLDTITLSELQEKIKHITLFARVAPIQKLKIIEALQANGEVVAMTGDGVNDAPALKKADIGIAVGSATDVAKAASDLILLDSDFKTIVSAVEEGRIIFANIKKVVAYVLSNSFAEIVLILGALVVKSPLPLTIVQILWIHLICDGPPDIVLGFEPMETGIMKDKPRKLIKENILALPMLFLVFAISLTAGLVSLFAFIHVYNTHNLLLAQTIAFSVLGLIDLTYIFSYKDLRKSIFKTNLISNKYLLVAVIYGLIVLFLGIYHPALNSILGTEPISLDHWLYALGASVITILWVEIVKAISGRFSIPQKVLSRK